jgi:hypothetical protein
MIAITAQRPVMLTFDPWHFNGVSGIGSVIEP